MAKVKIRWTRTELFEREFDLDGYEPQDPEELQEDSPEMEAINGLDQKELTQAFEFCSDLEVLSTEVIDEADSTPEITEQAPKYKDDF